MIGSYGRHPASLPHRRARPGGRLIGSYKRPSPVNRRFRRRPAFGRAAAETGKKLLGPFVAANHRSTDTGSVVAFTV
jgi:hypothetical protein